MVDQRCQIYFSGEGNFDRKPPKELWKQRLSESISYLLFASISLTGIEEEGERRKSLIVIRAAANAVRDHWDQI